MGKHNMPQRETGVYRRSDSNLLQWRIKAPEDLRSLYPSQWAHRCSLGTPDLKEANRRAAQLRSDWLNRFERERKALKFRPQQPESITPEVAKALADTVRHSILKVDAMVRTNPEHWLNGGGLAVQMQGMPDYIADAVGEANAAQLAQYAVASARGRLVDAAPFMEEAADTLGLALDESAPGYADALKAVLHAIKDAYAHGVQRDKGETVETPPAPSLKQAEAQKPRKLRDVFDKWKASRDEESDNVKKKAAALKLYEEQTGNPPLSKLRRDQGAEFKTFLLKQDWSSKTQHDKLDAVKTLLNYAERDLEWMQRNPWKGLDIPYRTENKRRPWTAAQVQTLFGLPLFTKYELPKATFKNGGAAAYWLPLLGLFTGARIGELCQLRTADVVTVDGIACISINDEGEGSTVKTDAGHREVPLHSELLRLGFLEYVEAMRKAGEERLWPALKLRDGKPGGYFSQWFGEMRKTLTEEVPDFHSIRHTVRSKLAAARIPVPEQDRITGHEAKGSEGVKTYTHYTAAHLRNAVESISYQGLALPKAFQPPA